MALRGKWQVGVVGRGRSRHYRLCEPHSCQSLKSDLFDSRVGGPDAFSLGIFAFNMPIVLSVNLCCRNSGSRRDGLTVAHAVIFLMHAWSFIRTSPTIPITPGMRIEAGISLQGPKA